MAVYKNNETGELVHAYEFTGKNQDFIIRKLMEECHFTKPDAIHILSIMEEHDTVMVQCNDMYEVLYEYKPNAIKFTILPKSKFIKWYSAFTVKG